MLSTNLLYLNDVYQSRSGNSSISELMRIIVVRVGFSVAIKFVRWGDTGQLEMWGFAI